MKYSPLLVAWILVSSGCAQETTVDGAKRVAVNFSGGHETVGVDRGRPVILIAGALQVQPQVFREAFSRVRPARGGHPSRERARQNKSVLMAALSPHGVTNDRLDEVSNYYRYNPRRGEMWPTREAKAYALVKDGRITGFEIKDSGCGYSSPPTVTIPGVNSAAVDVKLAFSKDFERNGSIAAISVRGR